MTGKPIWLEARYAREAATGRGVVYMFREAAPQLDLTPSDTRFVVQGFGNVGSRAARIMQEHNADRPNCRMVVEGANSPTSDALSQLSYGSVHRS